MADRLKGITIEIGGDTTGLSKALKGVDSQIKTTKNELKDVEKLLKLDPHNTELLAQKQKLLKQAIGETKDRLDTLHKAEKQLKDNGVDKNSDQFQALRREIISTEQNMTSLGKESKETNKQIKNGGKTAEEVKASWEKFGSAVATGAKALASATAAVGAAGVAVGGALAGATRQGAEYADNLLTQAQVTGISTEKLQEYAYAANLVDVNVETITGSMRKNIKAMSEAASGTGKYAETYKKLGVSVTNADGSLRDSEEVYWEVIDALGQVDNETERDALAMELLGKSAQDLNPLINAGSQALTEYGKQAKDAGYILSDDSLSAFGAFDDQMQKLSLGTNAAKNALGTVLLPMLTTLAGEGVDLLGEFTSGITGANGDISKMGEVIADILPKVVQMVLDNLPMLVDTVKDILGAVLGVLIDNLPEIVDAALDIVLMIVDVLLENLDKLIDAAIEIILALADGLIEALPKLIPAVIQAVFTIVDKLTEPNTLTKLIMAGFQLLMAVIDGIFKALPQIVGAVLKIAGNLRETFMNLDWSGIWDGIVDAAKKVWEGIKQVFGKVGEFFGNTFKSAWEKVTKVFSVAGKIFTDIKDGIVNAFKKVVNGLITGINNVISKPFEGINSALNKIRDINILGATPFKGLPTITAPKIPMLASGGVMTSGSAIVGEAGAELLTVENGRAIVQPLTNNNFSAPISINVYGAEGQNVNQLAEAVADRIQMFVERKANAY